MRNVGLLLLGTLAGVGLVLGVLYAAPAPALGGALAQATAAVSATVVPVAPAVSSSGGLYPEEQVLVDLYQRVAPAVVNITNSRGSAVAGEFPRTGAGSGIVFDDRGYILTNNHVVDDASRLEVSLADGTNVPGQLLGRDPANDLAVVKIDVAKEKLHTAPFGDSDALKAGQMAIAIGSPFGFERTITTGIISSVGRTRGDRAQRPIRNMIQTDAPINPGNSGGPLLNSRGEVVGITTAIESPVRGSVGIGFAVPINTAKIFLPQMLAGAKVNHPWLGISVVEMTPARAADLGITTTEGIYVADVVPDGPAQKGGIRGAGGRGTARSLAKGGDVVVAIDGQKIVKQDDIPAYLDRKKVGDVVKVEVVRDGARQTLDVTLGEWPDNAGNTPQSQP